MELLLVFHQTKVLPDLWEKLKGSGYRKPEVLRAFHSSSAYQHFLVEVSFFFDKFQYSFLFFIQLFINIKSRGLKFFKKFIPENNLI